jgi:lipoic acid synthetase
MAIVLHLPILSDFSQDFIPAKDLARPLPPSQAEKFAPMAKPSWLKVRPPVGPTYKKIQGLLRERGLNTVCEEAHCPNIAECWASGTATFMLGGDTCTRACRFCAIKTARVPPPLDPDEPRHIAQSIARLGLRYVVLTSVDRDDLPDQGSTHFAETIVGIKQRDSHLVVEALVPDFQGDIRAIETIVDARLDVYAHNVETVQRLQYQVRDPRANYYQSLLTLSAAKDYARRQGWKLLTKSSLMLGLGEQEEELETAFADLRKHEVDILTLGQYLRPSSRHLPVQRYWSVEEFEKLQKKAESYGFLYVAAGPMVRSSYRAADRVQGWIDSEKGKRHGVSITRAR